MRNDDPLLQQLELWDSGLRKVKALRKLWLGACVVVITPAITTWDVQTSELKSFHLATKLCCSSAHVQRGSVPVAFPVLPV